MSKYLIISIIIIIISSIFISIKQTKKIRKNHKELISFIYTLIATFISVFLALYYNNISIENQEKKTTTKILEAAYNELDLIQIETELRINKIKEEKNIKLAVLKQNFPIPTIFSKNMSNDVILKTISGRSLRAMNNGWRTLSAYHKIISDPQDLMSLSDDEILNNIITYKKELIFCKQIVIIERDYINRKFDHKSLDDKIDQQYKALLSK